ncbi:MAG: hypothetical protein M1828_005506 [Chrysothrix sp. TS-e1954]|nr:MAG: hypothetical protein M1828_005506 [Chrysothrix sp. TS-e1954]
MALILGSTAPSAWALARARLLEGVSDEEKGILCRATPESMFYEANVEHRTYSARSRAQKLQRRLRPLTNALQEYGKALDTYANASPTILCPLWGSIRLLMVWSRASQDCQEKIVSMFVSIGAALPQLGSYETLFPDSLAMRNMTADAYMIIADFCTSIRKMVQSHQHTTSLRFAWKALIKPFDHCLEGALLKLGEHREALSRQALIEHMSREKAAWGLLEQRNDEKRHRKLLQSLFVFDYTARHRMLCGSRHGATCSWILQHPTYLQWAEQPSSEMLIIEGIPGCGKSIMTSFIIEKALTATNGSKICYHHCDYADERTLDPANILSSLAYQLLEKSAIPHEACIVLEDRPHKYVAIDMSTALKVLQPVCPLFASIVFYLDGFDELRDQAQKVILESLQEIMSDHSCFKIAVSCRTETNSLRNRALVSTPRLRLQSSLLGSDIELFIRDTIETKKISGSWLKMDHKLESEVLSFLLERAKDMFLWVKLQIELLCTAQSSAEVRASLKILPKTLHETYERMFAKMVASADYEHLQLRLSKCFSWVLYVKRPMAMTELREAIAIDPGDHFLDGRKLMMDEGERLIASCGNFLSKDLPSGVVRFIHHSAYQFIKDLAITRVSALNLSETLVAKTLISLLSFDEYRKRDVPALSHHKPASPSRLSLLADAFAKVWQITKGASLRGLMDPLVSSSTSFDIAATISLLQRNLEHNHFLTDYAKCHWAYHAKVLKYEDLEGTHMALLHQLVLQGHLRMEYKPWCQAEATNKVSHRQQIALLCSWIVKEGHLLFLRILDGDQSEERHLAHYLRTPPEGEGALFTVSWESGDEDFVRFLWQRYSALIGRPPELMYRDIMQCAATQSRIMISCLLDLVTFQADKSVDGFNYGTVAFVLRNLFWKADWPSVCNLVGELQVRKLYSHATRSQRHLVLEGISWEREYEIATAIDIFFEDGLDGCAERFCFDWAIAINSARVTGETLRHSKSDNELIEAWIKSISNSSTRVSRCLSKTIEARASLFDANLLTKVAELGDASSVSFLLGCARKSQQASNGLRSLLPQVMIALLKEYRDTVDRAPTFIKACHMILEAEECDLNAFSLMGSSRTILTDVATIKERRYPRTHAAFVGLLLERAMVNREAFLRSVLEMFADTFTATWDRDLMNCKTFVLHEIAHPASSKRLRVSNDLEGKALEATKSYTSYFGHTRFDGEGGEASLFAKSTCFTCAFYANYDADGMDGSAARNLASACATDQTRN